MANVITNKMKTLFSIILLACSYNATACYCGSEPLEWYWEKHDTVLHVRVGERVKSNENLIDTVKDTKIFPEVTATVLHPYKSTYKKDQIIAIWSYVYASCANLYIKDIEYIIFGTKYDEKLHVEGCAGFYIEENGKTMIGYDNYTPAELEKFFKKM